jgi:hypothetical protein
LVPKTSAYLETISAAEAHLTERKYLLEKQTLKKAKSLLYEAGRKKKGISKQGKLEQVAVHQGATFSYVIHAILTALKSTYLTDMAKEAIKSKGWKILLDAFQIHSVSLRHRVPTSLDLTRAKYDRYRTNI